MKEWIIGTSGGLFAFMYPRLADYLKKGEFPQRGGPLPMPFSRIPREAFYESSFKDPEKRGFGEHREVFDHLKRGSMLFLGEDFDQVITLERKGHLLRGHCSDEAVGGDLT